MAERASLTTFVMTADVPWPADAPAADRLGMLDPVTVYAGGAARQCSVARISPHGATLRQLGGGAIGSEVAVELATGQRVGGTVDWTQGDEAGVRFRQPIDMVALLNRTLLAQVSERRKMPRVELRCAVGLRWGASVAAAHLRNISAQGLQVEGDDLPGRDTFVSLAIDGLNLPAGIVVWQKERLAGIELMEELAWSSLMPWIRDQHRKSAA